MSIEQQRTFGALVGMAPKVATARLPLDLVECSDGKLLHHEDVQYDCRDNPHSTDEDRLEADVAIVTDLLNGVAEWATEYCTESSDYADGYSHIIDEVSHDWPDAVKQWLESAYGDIYGHTKFDDCMDKIVEAICDGLQGSFDAEPQYCSNEYAGYSGDGCCLWGTDIGEHEEQIDISCYPELQELHERGDLDDVLDHVNCDVYVSRNKRREKNEETGRYECVGRETYDAYGSDHPTFEVYTMPGGRWDWVVSKERMEELLTAAIIEVARRNG